MKIRCLLLLSAVCLSGCADDDVASTEVTATDDPVVADSAIDPASVESAADVGPATLNSRGTNAATGTAAATPIEFAPLGMNHATSQNAAAPESSVEPSKEERIAEVMEKLKPLQVVLGQWRGTTRKEFDGFKKVDQHEWIWDLQSDPAQPALMLKSDKSPYLRQARLTWDPQQDQFLLQATDADGQLRHYAGDFTEPVREVTGPDDKLHRVFRLQMTETPESAATSGNEAWQVAFAQQENNRYLLQLDKRRGAADFRRYDTVSTQREGTSFALDDSDYREKTCIISQGLGTMTVSWKGKTYWVCCTGCKAAFEEDPEAWIARAAKRSDTQ